MKKLSTVVVVGVLSAALSVPLAAQTPNISGQWELTRSGGPGGGGGGARRRDMGGPLKMTIQQEGETFTGALEMPFGEARITEGTIKGDEVSFKVVMETQRGTFEMAYTGKIEGDTMAGTVSTQRGQSEWTAKKVETNTAGSS